MIIVLSGRCLGCLGRLVAVSPGPGAAGDPAAAMAAARPMSRCLRLLAEVSPRATCAPATALHQLLAHEGGLARVRAQWQDDMLAAAVVAVRS